MRCKACNASLEGGQMDLGLCGACAFVSNMAVEEAQELSDKGEGSKYQEPSLARFNAHVKKHGLIESWAEGLDLMDTGARVVMLGEQAWLSYCDHLESGLTHERALRRATGVAFRRSQMHTHSGAIGSTGEDGEPSTGGSGMVLENDVMGSESVSWGQALKDY